jgi:hypothetical protein
MVLFPPGRSIENAKSNHLTSAVCFSFRRIKQIINDAILPAVRTWACWVEYGGQYANIMIIHEQETSPPLITIYAARISPEPHWNHYLNN